MTFEELLQYITTKAQWHLDEAKRLMSLGEYAKAGQHSAMAEAYSDVGMKLGVILCP